VLQNILLCIFKLQETDICFITTRADDSADVRYLYVCTRTYAACVQGMYVIDSTLCATVQVYFEDSDPYCPAYHVLTLCTSRASNVLHNVQPMPHGALCAWVEFVKHRDLKWMFKSRVLHKYCVKVLICSKKYCP
jgi:hypothetical protein